jgi:hypothetical protein
MREAGAQRSTAGTQAGKTHLPQDMQGGHQPIPVLVAFPHSSLM